MPKKHVAFRLEEVAVQTLRDYAKEYNLQNVSQALQRIILRFKYLDKARAEQLQSTDSDELACVSRIKYDGVFWCVYKPPKMKELETLDICVVCKKRSLGLTEKSIMRSGAETESSPRLSMVHPARAPFSYAPDRTRSSDPLERPSIPRPQSFHCALGKNPTYCYNNLCDQRGTCETQVER